VTVQEAIELLQQPDNKDYQVWVVIPGVGVNGSVAQRLTSRYACDNDPVSDEDLVIWALR
jgi:hypothetical protein